MQLMLIKKFFNKHVTIIGKVPHRLEFAKRLGADNVRSVDEIYSDNNDKSIINEDLLRDPTFRYSPNLIYISNNNPDSLNLAIKMINKNGHIVIFSGIKNQLHDNNNKNKINKTVNVDPNFIHYNQVSVLGSFSSTPKDIKEAMKIIDDKEIDLKSLISQKYSLFKIKDAFLSTERYNGFKSIINKFC
jgi:L-iditol 2-dehydrogenase